MNEKYVDIANLKVAEPLYQLVDETILPGLEISSNQVWKLLSQLVTDLGPRNQDHLDLRDDLQNQIDEWLKISADNKFSEEDSLTFLQSIGYLVPEGPDFQVVTTNVDTEIAHLAGPQLVVPVDNARYALNAANARWGSLFDALYGTNIISENNGAEKTSGYNPVRGEQVITYVNILLDDIIPIQNALWNDVRSFAVQDSKLSFVMSDGSLASLVDPENFVGYTGDLSNLSSVLFQHNDLHIDLLIDPHDPVGAQHSASIKDVMLEAAVTTIMDCEDAVAAVDAEDKVNVYANWLGLMKGTLETTFIKADEEIIRTLNDDRSYTASDGSEITLSARSLMLIRHVGAHIYTDVVTTESGALIPETFLDAVITILASIHDINNQGFLKNSLQKSVYVVKPKQHGPDEIALSVELFERIEEAFGIESGTVKIGIMDEERRTTLNLKECIRAAKDRVIFINTGFLDRTGDEIHTHMHAGAMIPKPDIKSARWMVAYEDWNVDIGIATGLAGNAQIGKGMWAQPDEMLAMLETKHGHPYAGASCAWVPSPTAATLHSIHYHQTYVRERQRIIADRTHASINDLLSPPLLKDQILSSEDIQNELENNLQGILGYVARWVEQGIGCSKVPDINDVGLMEDRATLRISSQHVSNWLLHGLIDENQVLKTMEKMAEVVDRQNIDDAGYTPMASDFENSFAFQAAVALIFEGREQPNGYTELLLWKYRKAYKANTLID
ncbi:MAG: malate synthase G [Chloroflexi bacterium]|nr:malate synthase G [Chloroflexota bacterium]